MRVQSTPTPRHVYLILSHCLPALDVEFPRCGLSCHLLWCEWFWVHVILLLLRLNDVVRVNVRARLDIRGLIATVIHRTSALPALRRGGIIVRIHIS